EQQLRRKERDEHPHRSSQPGRSEHLAVARHPRSPPARAMISDPFDTGPTGTFRTLCRNYPDDTVYKGADGFRSLWGPIFYRGRANGTARLLAIGQDPAQTEAVTRHAEGSTRQLECRPAEFSRQHPAP